MSTTSNRQQGSGSTLHHVQIDIYNALQHWKASEWEGVVRYEGKPLSATETRKCFESLRAQGCRYLPVGKPCDGWDPATGCPGHPV